MSYETKGPASPVSEEHRVSPGKDTRISLSLEFSSARSIARRWQLNFPADKHDSDATSLRRRLEISPTTFTYVRLRIIQIIVRNIIQLALKALPNKGMIISPGYGGNLIILTSEIKVSIVGWKFRLFCHIVCLQWQSIQRFRAEMFVSIKLSVKYTALPAAFSSFQIFLDEEITEFSKWKCC